MSHKSLLQRLAEKLGEKDFNALAEGMSDNQLRQKLNRALRDTVPAFWGVEEVFRDSSTAIYLTSPAEGLQFWECSFSVDGENVTLGRRKRVEPVTRWEKVAAAGAGDASTDQEDDKPELKANCKCHETAANPADGEAAHKGTEGDGTMSDKIKELVGRLTANAATKLTDANAEALAALGEEQLEAMVALVEKPAEKVEVPAKPDPNLVTFTAEEASSMRRALAQQQQQEKLHRAALTKALVDSGECKYSEAQLAKKDTEDLELLAESLGVLDEPATVVDYAGRGLHAVNRTDESTLLAAARPPNSWNLDANTAKQLGCKVTAATSSAS